MKGIIVMKAYVVVIDGYFTRDGQVYVSDEAGIDQFYKDIHGRDVYLGIYHWNAGDIPGLIAHVAHKHGLPVGILQAYEV